MEKPICFEGLGLSCEGASTPQGRAENECCSCEWYAWFDEEDEVECELKISIQSWEDREVKYEY